MGVTITDEKFFLLRWMCKQEGLAQKEVARRLKIQPSQVRYWLAKDVAPSMVIRSHTKDSRRPNIVLRQQRVKQLVEKVDRVKRTKFSPKLRKPSVRTSVYRPFGSPEGIVRELERAFDIHSSKSQVLRDLKAIGKVPRRRGKGPYLTKKHISDRLIFCRKMLREKTTLLFSDECYISTNEASGGGGWQWCDRGQLADRLCWEQGPPKLMIWGVIGKGVKELHMFDVSENMNSVRYLKMLRKRGLLAKLKKAARAGHTFQQDGSTSHAQSAINFLESHGIRVLRKWPSKSPDLSIIELMWQHIKFLVRKEAPYGIEQLKAFIQKAWDEYPQERIDRMIDNWPLTLKLCVKHKGATVKAPRAKKK